MGWAARLLPLALGKKQMLDSKKKRKKQMFYFLKKKNKCFFFFSDNDEAIQDDGLINYEHPLKEKLIVKNLELVGLLSHMTHRSLPLLMEWR